MLEGRCGSRLYRRLSLQLFYLVESQSSAARIES